MTWSDFLTGQVRLVESWLKVNVNKLSCDNCVGVVHM